MRRLWLQIGRSTKGQRATKGGTKCERPSGNCLSHGCQMCVCECVVGVRTGGGGAEAALPR